MTDPKKNEDSDEEEEDSSSNSDSVEPFIGPLRERPAVVWCGDYGWQATEVKQYARPVAPEQVEHYLQSDDRVPEASHQDPVYWTELVGTPDHDRLQRGPILEWKWDPEWAETDAEEGEEEDDDEDVDKQTSQEKELLEALGMMSAGVQAAERIHVGRPLDGDLRLVARARRYSQDMKNSREDVFKVAPPKEEKPN